MILQACPECDRQYDITSVKVGSRIRCACDQVMTVRIPKEVTVRARKCGNCGGAIELGELACGFCASKLVELDLDATLCPNCFKRVEGDARHCQGCGTRIKPQSVAALGADTWCPRCQGDFRTRSLGEACVVECTGCEGLWISADIFDELCRDAHSSPEFQLGSTSESHPVQARKFEKVQYIPCLSCSQLMLQRNFRYGTKSSHVIIDYCQDHGIWLDKRELERVMSFIRERASDPSGSGEGLSGSLDGGHRGALNGPSPKLAGIGSSLGDGAGSGFGTGSGRSAAQRNLTVGSVILWLLRSLFY